MKYIKMLQNYLGSQERWNELGHSFMSFIMGCMHPIILVLWIGFAIIDEVVCDGHWNYFKETKEKQLDFWFDLQSKILPSLVGYIYISNIVVTDHVSWIDSLAALILIFFFGYKGHWFYPKK